MKRLTAVNLPFMRENHQGLAKAAADKHWSHLDYFGELLNCEAAQREDRRVRRGIRQARFPVLKTIAHAAGGLKRALAACVKPEVLCVDELGYLPIDKFGADCLFQIISHRYERGSTLLTTNRPFKQWAGIFNNDATLTSALLDRLLDHGETVVIEGKSYRGQAQTGV